MLGQNQLKQTPQPAPRGGLRFGIGVEQRECDGFPFVNDGRIADQLATLALDFDLLGKVVKIPACEAFALE